MRALLQQRPLFLNCRLVGWCLTALSPKYGDIVPSYVEMCIVIKQQHPSIGLEQD